MKIIDQVFHSTSDEDESNIKLYSSSDLEDNKKWVPLDINKEEYGDIFEEKFPDETRFSPKFRLMFGNQDLVNNGID